VLSYSGHLLMENRNGLCVDVSVGAADGHAEREHALKMLRRLLLPRISIDVIGQEIAPAI